MKAKCFLYHVDCFKCAVCNAALIKGDLFGMYEAVVYCQTHYRQQQQEQQFNVSDEFSQYEGYDEAFISGGGGGGGAWSPAAIVQDNNNSIIPVTKKKRGRRKRDLSEDEASRACFPYLDPASSLADKTKRARTSFKHHQLRIMKSHFQMNQNPDSRELKDLASKTGLDKKVLQASPRIAICNAYGNFY
jgi:LIM homeobox protein 2/9